MKPLLLISFLAFSVTVTYSQDSTKTKFPFSDTTMTEVNLPAKLDDKKIVRVYFDEEWTIYLKEKNVWEKASEMAYTKYMSPDIKKENKNILAILKKSKKDTTNISFSRDRYYFIHILCDEITKGEAVLFNKKTKKSETKILHRMERYISIADIVFYFSDRKRFFSVTRYHGVIPNELIPDIEEPQ